MTITSRRIFKLSTSRTFCKTAVLSGLLAALCAAPAFADDTADVTRLLRAGQYAEALGKADAFLGKNPRDAQMRFLKGVILTEQNKSAEAIVVFTRLTEEFPALPEPYNNLAVLYAAAGQYDKARAALDAAIRTNPTYATAYENLGDVHAKMASQAYDKALQLDSGNSGAKSKLTLVRTLVGNGNSAVAVAAAPAPMPAKAPIASAAPSATSATSTPPAASKPIPQMAQAPQPADPAPKVTPVPKAASAPAPALAPSAPVAVAKAEAKPAPNTKDERDDVLNAVNGWAKAWSSRNVKGYLAYYGDDFATPGGQSRKAWEEERRNRIDGKGRIEVKVEDPRVDINGNSATVKFRQVYLSDRLTANTRKTLLLAKRGGKWQIKQEQASK